MTTEDKSLSAVHCDECQELIGYQSSQPRPYMVCPKCNEPPRKLTQGDYDAFWGGDANG
jgi:Zn finger protein HypA/HybF involved in hydrogenase expression